MSQQEARYAIQTVGAAVFSDLHFVEAPARTALPYAIWQFVSMPFNRDTAKQYEEYFFQYLLFCAQNDLATYEATKASLDAAFDIEANYSVEGHTVNGVYQQNTFTPRLVNEVWQIGSQFKLEIEPI